MEVEEDTAERLRMDKEEVSKFSYADRILS